MTGRALGVTAKVAAKSAAVTGKLAVKGVVKSAEVAYERREQIGKVTGKAFDAVVTTAAVAGYGAYKATEWTAKKIYDHREEIGGAVHGAATGTAIALTDASGHFVDLKPRVERINAQSAEYRRRIQEAWSRLKGTPGYVTRRDVLLDTIVVGGSTLAAYAEGLEPVPDEVGQAFEAAYPGLAAQGSFADAIRHMSTEELQGFASGVKGKLFELEYVDYLNDGHLPSAYAAELATSATQPGWDIRILGPEGHTAQVIQAKATESVEYVKQALERYPSIDVVTTSEVYGHLVMQGFAENVIDGGISGTALQASVDAANDAASVHMHWMPSTISLALIAFSSYSKEGLDAYEKSRRFGERASKSYLAYLAGGALAVATNTWWIGVIGGVGTRMVIGSGRRKWERKAQLDELICANEKILRRLAGAA